MNKLGWVVVVAVVLACVTLLIVPTTVTVSIYGDWGNVRATLSPR